VAEQTLPKLPLVNPNTLNWRPLTKTEFVVIGKMMENGTRNRLYMLSGGLVERLSYKEVC